MDAENSLVLMKILVIHLSIFQLIFHSYDHLNENEIIDIIERDIYHVHNDNNNILINNGKLHHIE
jgi:hypothetical protein